VRIGKVGPADADGRKPDPDRGEHELISAGHRRRSGGRSGGRLGLTTSEEESSKKQNAA
jgi:hypothetical protein